MTKGLRLLFIVMAALVLVGGFFAIRLLTVTEQQWARMQSRVELLRRENEGRTYARPVLQGKPEPGNSWDDYAAAGATAVRVKWTYDLLYYVRGNYPKDPYSKAAAAAAPLLGSLERLRLGARKTESRPRVGYYHAMNPVMEEDRGVYRLPWAGMVQARALLDEGHAGDAVDLWLDLLQYGRDQADGTCKASEYVALDMLDYLAAEVRTTLMGNRLPPESLRTLDRALEILSRSWPPGKRLLDNHLLALGLGLTAEAEEDTIIYQGQKKRIARSWRWMFSNRLRAARTFNFCDMLATELHPKDPEAALAAAWDWPDPVVEDTLMGVLQRGTGLPFRLRMLKIAVRFAATGEVLDLPSGIDRPFRISQEGPALRIALPDPRVPDDGSSDNWWWGGKPVVIRVVRSP